MIHGRSVTYMVFDPSAAICVVNEVVSPDTSP
jgi:hypothetical protein